MKQEDIVTFYGKVRISNKPNDATAGGLSHYRINTNYVNNIRKVVRVKLRSNLDIMVPAAHKRTQYVHDEMFVVQKELVVSAACIEIMRQYFAHLSDASGELEAFRKVYLQVYENIYRFGQTKEIRCQIEYGFTEGELNANGGMFYHNELDTMFKLGEEPILAAHPHSEEGRRQAALEAADKIKDEHGFVFWVEIIDNLGKYGERFVSICNQIYKIVPRRDKNRQDGLYIVSSTPSNGRINSNEVFERRYPLDNVDKDLGIYPTYELAQTHGDIAGSRKREQQEREHEYNREKQQWAQEKLKLEREADERERHLRHVEQERTIAATQMKELRDRQEHLAEMQRLHMKDKYDERQAERKDASEFIKFLPSILAAVGTILMVWKTFKGS